MHRFKTIAAGFALLSGAGCFSNTEFTTAIPDPPIEQICVPDQRGAKAVVVTKEFQCMQDKAEHFGNCDSAGANCQAGCKFTVKTEESTSGGQVLKPFEKEIFVPEGFHGQMKIRLKSRRGPGTRRDIPLNRLYSGPNALYPSPVLLAKIHVETTCP